MNTGQRTITTLLAVVAVMLGINLMVNLPPEAGAQDQFDLEAARTPHVIQVETAGLGRGRVFRLWSDGVIEDAVFDHVDSACLPQFDGVAWQEIAETVPLPPGVRITRIYTRVHTQDLLLRLRSDGVVEQNIRAGNALGFCGWRTPPE